MLSNATEFEMKYKIKYIKENIYLAMLYRLLTHHEK